MLGQQVTVLGPGNGRIGQSCYLRAHSDPSRGNVSRKVMNLGCYATVNWATVKPVSAAPRAT